MNDAPLTDFDRALVAEAEVRFWRGFIADMARGLREGAAAHPEMPILAAGFVKVADQLDEHLRATLTPASPPPARQGE